MTDHYYDPVGRCIYCGEVFLPHGASRFNDEHIISLGMGGNLILPEAVCKRCERTINKEVENPVLKHEWEAFRDRYGLPTRKPRDRKKRDFKFLRNTDGTQIKIPLSEHSTPVLIYEFQHPRILTQIPSTVSNDLHFTARILSNTKSEAKLQAAYPTWDKTHSLRARPEPFARFLAKTAYSYAIAQYAKSEQGTFQPLVTDVILGKSANWPHFVGCFEPNPPKTHEPIGHSLSLSTFHPSENFALLAADIQLFPQFGLPIYVVIVGAINFKNTLHIAAFQKNGLHRKKIDSSR